jgi:hypothetical protein
VRNGEKEYDGVTGWLLLFCCVLIFVVPTSTIYQVFTHTLPLISKTHSLKREILWTVYAALFVIVAALALVTGVRLWMVCAGAVRLAKVWLLAFLCAHASYFVLWLIMFRRDHTSSVREVGWHHVVSPALAFSLWITYLEYSKRVRDTYSKG